MSRVSTEHQRRRDRRALLIFASATLFLFAFFAAGAYIGRWSKASHPAPPPAEGPARPASAEMLRVEAATAESKDRADEIVASLRRKYTSATAELDRADGRHHVYVGPYPAPEAEAVAAEIRELGFDEVELKPFAP